MRTGGKERKKLSSEDELEKLMGVDDWTFSSSPSTPFTSTSTSTSSTSTPNSRSHRRPPSRGTARSPASSPRPSKSGW